MRALSQIALSDEGFVFDPNTGDSFQVSATGLFLIQALKDGRSDDEAAQLLTEKYEVSLEEARRDCADFRSRLRNLNLA